MTMIYRHGRASSSLRLRVNRKRGLFRGKCFPPPKGSRTGRFPPSTAPLRLQVPERLFGSETGPRQNTGDSVRCFLRYQDVMLGDGTSQDGEGNMNSNATKHVSKVQGPFNVRQVEPFEDQLAPLPLLREPLSMSKPRASI